MKILNLYATIRNPFSSVCGKYIYIFNNWGMAIVQYVDETFHLTMHELFLPVVLQHLWCVGGELLCGEEHPQRAALPPSHLIWSICYK